MDRLPPELNKIILNYLNTEDDWSVGEDLKSLRLVTKSLSALVTPALFRKVSLWISVKSLQNLSNIAKHLGLARLVETIVFSPIRIREHANEMQELSDLQELFELKCNSLNDFYLSVKRHSTLTKYYVSGQDFLAKDNVDIKIMAMAFCRLPNFRNVIISDGNRRIGAKELHRLMGRLWGTEVSLSGTHTLKAFMKALAEAGVELRKFKMVEAKRDRSARKENQSGQVPSNREKDFVVQRGFQCVTKKALQECFSDLPLPTMHALFRKVKFLKIEGQKQEMPISVGLEGEAISCYHSILEFAKNVERLELKSLGSNPDDDRTHPQLTTLIPRYEPCRISLLTLRVFWCTVGEAIHLFSCRAGSLVDVQLEFVEIKGGDWSVVLSSLRKYPFTKLKHFHLNWCDDRCRTVDAANYITRKMDEDPFTSDVD